MPEENKTDRRTQNSLLTDAHRQFLPDQENYFTGENAAQMRNEKRREIVDRVRHGLHDFSVLFRHLRPAELEAIFGEGDVDTPPIEAAVRDTIAVLFLGLADELVLRSDAPGPAIDARAGHVSREFEDVLEKGLRLGYRKRDFLLESVLLDVRSQGRVEDLETLLDKLDAGTASREELLYLLQTIDLPTGPIQESVHRTIKDHMDID